MIVDSSALLAILFNEGDAEIYARALTTDICRISAANYVEVAIVIESQTREPGSRYFDSFFRRASIGVEPVTKNTRTWLVRRIPSSARAVIERA